MRALANDPNPADCGAVWDLLDLWKCKCRASICLDDVGSHGIAFSTHLRHVRLNLMDDVACLVVWDRSCATRDFVKTFWHKARAAGRIQLILAVSEAAHQETKWLTERPGTVLLGPDDIASLLHCYGSLQLLKGYICRRFRPLTRLIPYDTGKPAKSNMFFGRAAEVLTLQNERTTSFAIAGPSRIGKTSLVRYYWQQTRETDEDHSRNMFFVDFYNCCDKSPGGVAHHVARAIDPLLNHDEITTARSLEFLLRRHVEATKHPVELLLDEVDLVLYSPALSMLGRLANDGVCRLILSGKEVLLSAISSGASPIDHYLSLMHLDPLDNLSAMDLLLKPLADLGIVVEAPNIVIPEVSSRTEQLPEALQSLGRRLAEFALARRCFLLTHADIRDLERGTDPSTRKNEWGVFEVLPAFEQHWLPSAKFIV